MTSLAELRMIEEQRIVGERNARIAEEQARKDAIARAERDARDAAEAKVAAERAQALAIETARVTAEREARMRVEAAEAADRARHAAALETIRIENELVLRREAIRKTRPTWMIGVTLCAVIAGAALAVFAVKSIDSANVSDEIAKRARDAADAANKEKNDYIAQAETLRQKSADLDRQITDAMALIDKKQSLAEAAANKKHLEDLAKQKRENDDIIRRNKEAHDKKVRADGLKIKPECLKNAYAKGCIP